MVVAQFDSSHLIGNKFKKYKELFQSLRDIKKIDSLNALLYDTSKMNNLESSINWPDSNFLGKVDLPQPIVRFPVFSKPIIDFNGGYINYQWNFRSGIDTPFVEKNLSQHLITSSASLTIANALPLRITYFERQSNSAVFRDFRDVRVELDVASFQQLKQKRIKDYLIGYYNQSKDPFVKPFQNQLGNNIDRYLSWLNNTANRKKWIDSKEILISPDIIIEKPGVNKDSILQDAGRFIQLYESLNKQKDRQIVVYDSLSLVYKEQEQRFNKLKQLLNSNLNNPDMLQKLGQYAKEVDIKDDKFNKMMASFGAVKTLAVGKTMPNFSSLTLKNTNIRGLDFEYNKNHLYLAAVVGKIDLRVRDFVYSNQKGAPQYVYALKGGYGTKDGSNLLLTYYAGKKQLFSGSTGMRVQSIKGVSLSTQIKIHRTTKLLGEIAQSASPDFVSVIGSSEKSSFNFRDSKNLAYSIGIRSLIQETGTKFEAQFQHQGLNFQNFTNYRPNAATDNWNIKLEQYLWRRHFKLIAGFRKNDFSNSFILQRYNSNAVFKQISATFQKKGLPTISVGYMPSSQYALVDSLVYENQYQVLTSSMHYSYNIGLASSNTTFSFNKFYNDISDSAFLFYNSSNLFLNQSIRFKFYTSNLSWTHSDNGNYVLDVLDGGLLFHAKENHAIGFGVKVNHLNLEKETKIGYYGNGRVSIRNLGDLSVLFEKNYLATIQSSLGKNEFYSISFTRYFK